MKQTTQLLTALACLTGVLSGTSRADVIEITVAGTFASDPADLFGNLDPALFPFPLLLGGTFSGTYTYDSDVPPVGLNVQYLSVDVDIIDTTGTVIHTIDTGPNGFRIFDGSADANLGESFGAAAINLPEDLRLSMNGAFVSGVTPDEVVMLGATPDTTAGVTGSFLEVDGVTAFTFWDLPVESYTLSVGCGANVAAIETVRLGVPPNPPALQPGMTSGPVIGKTWDPWIGHTPFFPGATLDLLGVALAPANVPLPPYGTMLCDFIGFPPYIYSSAPGVPFKVVIPIQCNLAGVKLCSQGLSTDGVKSLLTNAIDIRIGTF